MLDITKPIEVEQDIHVIELIVLQVGEAGQNTASRHEVQTPAQVHHALLPLRTERVSPGLALHCDRGHAYAREIQLQMGIIFFF